MTKKPRKEGNVLDTVVMIIVIAALFLMAYVQISSSLRIRSLGRLEEGVKTVMEEVQSKLERDSDILNATADIIAAANFTSADGEPDTDALLETMQSAEPLFETMNLRLLLPDERVLTADGTITDVSTVDDISFAAEAPLGEHVSNRVKSVNGDSYILRHFVPVVQGGQTVALLYGVTMLDELAGVLNIDNIYNASATIYIVDTRNGDFIMDTWATYTNTPMAATLIGRPRAIRTGTSTPRTSWP